MLTDKTLAILASAYNVCGPRIGQGATPATVLDMASPADLAAMLAKYSEHCRANMRDSLYSDAELTTAAESIAAMRALAA